MKFEIINPDGNVATPKVEKPKKKRKSSEYIVFETEGSCGCCCSSNSDVNPNKRCSVCEDCSHVGECEELYFYGRCVCGEKND